MDAQTEQTLANLEAQLVVHRMALRALARACPDPVAMLACWRAVRAEDASDHYTGNAPAGRGSILADRVQAYAEDFTADLVDLVHLGNGRDV